MGGDEAVFMQFDEQYYMKNRLFIHLPSAMRIADRLLAASPSRSRTPLLPDHRPRSPRASGTASSPRSASFRLASLYLPVPFLLFSVAGGGSSTTQGFVWGFVDVLRSDILRRCVTRIRCWWRFSSCGVVAVVLVRCSALVGFRLVLEI
ncbi:hypothetical protein M758_9G104800 [Ceratodon purpureus]|nr:hypothetical protein M758_9G104800 [Ceratodon purpureus]